MAYFNFLPKIQYSNKKSVYLLAKAKIVQEIFERYDAFYPYIIREGYTPQLVSYNVYGSAEYDWVVMFSCNVIDPYYDWPMTTNNLYSFIEKKYNKAAHLTKSDIMHYRYTGIGGESDLDISRKSWIMSTETYNQLSSEDKSGWSPVYVFDYELEENEKKRSIQLIMPNYIPQIESELKDIFR